MQINRHNMESQTQPDNSTVCEGYIKPFIPTGYEDKALRLQKYIDIANDVMRAASSIIEPLQRKIPYAYLLKKHPFPNRTLPHRIKRKMKKSATAERSVTIPNHTYARQWLVTE